MIDLIFYTLSFLTGVFIVWYLGKKNYLPEDKLIDLCVFPTVVALVVGRIGFLLFPIGANEINTIKGFSSVWIMIASVFNLSNGVLWWLVIVVYMAMTIGLIWKWHWEYTTTAMIVVIGVSLALVISQIPYLTGERWFYHLGIFTVGGINALLVILLYRSQEKMHLKERLQGIINAVVSFVNFNRPRDERI